MEWVGILGVENKSHPVNGYRPEDLLGLLNDVERAHAPARLYAQGDIQILKQGPRVAIVGSRQASASGLGRAATLARRLVAEGVTIVSGLALGIDAAAHQAAIDAGGRTIGVLGTPLDRFSPPQNRSLQERIGREHLLISQFPPGATTHRGAFPMRNRTMALLSHATVIVEAAEKSGTMHQGWEALRLGRELFLDESLLSSGFEWPKEMQQYGARVFTDATIEELLELLPGPEQSVERAF